MFEFPRIHVTLWGLSSAGRASALQAEGHRFEPCRPHYLADMAQLAEQLICNQQVIGSSPIVGFHIYIDFLYNEKYIRKSVYNMFKKG